MKKTIDWAKIKANAINNCSKCKSKKSYTNPLDKCFECKKKFCFDCLNALQINAKMKQNDEVRDICDECVKEHKYKQL